MSKKRDKEITLSEKLSSLIQTKPSAVESDDEDLVTVAKIDRNDNDSEYSADELDISKFRRLNSGLLEEDDKKYLGKGVSRKDLTNAEHSDFSENEEDSYSETPGTASERSNFENESNDDGEGSESEEEIESSEHQTHKKQKSNKKNEEDHFNKGIFVKASSDIEKGKAIKNQLHLWDFLLECRMKFQKCLLASNQLPSHTEFPKFKSEGSPLFYDSVVQCKKSLKHLLKSLLSLQLVLLNSNEDFLSSSKERKEIKENDSDEITSDSDRNDDAENEISTNNKYKSAKLKNLNDFSLEIKKRHENFLSYRNNIIQKWNDKTRIGYISNKNFSAFEQSTLKQIEHVLLDKERLIKRTQTKRSNYRILGEEDQEPPPKKAAKSDSFSTSVENKNKILHKEIFDDDDFYHQLLNELVKRKASDVTDPVQLGRQWMQLQKIRSKMKKTVDTKASKGRKVRFVVHPKLVNFMMPVDNSTYNDESKTELFNSLFGKTKK